MSLVLKDAFQLIEGVLEEGLPFVGVYLQKAIKRHVFTDNTGKIHIQLQAAILRLMICLFNFHHIFKKTSIIIIKQTADFITMSVL